VTGINVATMMVPPEPLLIFGAYYRPAWAVCCGLLQLMAVSVITIVAKISGVWPSSDSTINNNKVDKKQA
jgi:hypothetical protein